jgi:hypothetical protein
MRAVPFDDELLIFLSPLLGCSSYRYDPPGLSILGKTLFLASAYLAGLLWEGGGGRVLVSSRSLARSSDVSFSIAS